MLKRTGMYSEILYFPEEIIRTILEGLPVKSLVRFQCVCKEWRHLINDPSFVADHLQQSSHRNPYLLFEFDRSEISPTWSYYWRLHLLDCSLQLREVQEVPLIPSSDHYRIIGSCNGLLLCETTLHDQSLFVWNPATKATRHVPMTTTITDVSYFYCVTGFGFSSIVNDYKIVRTYAHFDLPVSVAEVFSLSRGSWKKMDVGNLGRLVLTYEIVANSAAILWTGLKLSEEEDDQYEGEEVIVSFDMAKEVFILIPMPNLGSGSAHKKLTVYDNKPALLCNIYKHRYGTPELIELWVLDEDTCASGETWSWSKRYTSAIPISCELEAVAIWGKEIVCVAYPENETGRSDLYMMNLFTNEIKRTICSCA